MSTKSKRLDIVLEEQGFFQSRQAARAAIMDGGVLVNGVKITKPGTPVKDGSQIQLTSSWLPQKYVSRGGYKLEKAIEEFQLQTKDRICLDVGASTGGFTDCLLQSGAKLVYAVDVGYGQIAWSLRSDPRVKVVERCNARSLNPEILSSTELEYEAPSLAVIDVSFISLIKVLPAVRSCLGKDFQIVALVKPQFEAGPEKVGKGGVVRSPEVHREVIAAIIKDAKKIELQAKDLSFSPLKGPQGNIEFLLLLEGSGDGTVSEKKIQDIVDSSASLQSR